MRDLLPMEIKMLLQLQATANDQVPVNPTAMTDGEVRSALFKMAQSITNQAQAIMYKARLFLERTNMLVVSFTTHILESVS